jgi:hypothetical protein
VILDDLEIPSIGPVPSIAGLRDLHDGAVYRIARAVSGVWVVLGRVNRRSALGFDWVWVGVLLDSWYEKKERR